MCYNISISLKQGNNRAKINRRFIDKHWSVFIIRGALACIFGFVTLFGMLNSIENVVSMLAMLLLVMGIIDSLSALYASAKRRGWLTAVIDSAIDVAAALCLLFLAKDNIVNSLIIVAAYTFVSGIVDLFHGFLSTVDPTDRFIRIVAGGLGCVMGLVILNAGSFELMTFIRFFGVYMLIVGVTSLIYGVHNRSQNIEDKVARKVSAKKTTKRKTANNKK